MIYFQFFYRFIGEPFGFDRNSDVLKPDFQSVNRFREEPLGL